MRRDNLERSLGINDRMLEGVLRLECDLPCARGPQKRHMQAEGVSHRRRCESMIDIAHWRSQHLEVGRRRTRCCIFWRRRVVAKERLVVGAHKGCGLSNLFDIDEFFIDATVTIHARCR